MTFDRTMRRLTLACLLTVTIVAVRPIAAAASQDDRAALKDRFEQRYPGLRQLKDSGRVGETWEGYVAATTEEAGKDPDITVVIAPENKDRKTLYRLLAEDVATDMKEENRERITARVIAERNAWRYFEKAPDGQLLEVAPEVWVTKKDTPWLLRLLKLKDKGQIGENTDGYVEAVRPDDDAELGRIIDKENAARRKRYERLSAAEGKPLERIARDHLKRYARFAHLGTMFRNPTGEWQAVVE